MPVPSLKLKANAQARVMQGHPWVFGNEVEQLLPAEFDGEVVECRDRNGRFLGSGIYNQRSQIVWRRLSRERVSLDSDFIRGCLARALEWRKALPTAEARRLVWSESDGLPGMVVDRFGDVLVVQVQTLAMEKRTPILTELLTELVGPSEIIYRNDAPIRAREGLGLEIHTVSGRAWNPRWFEIGGVSYWLDLERGQKTGFYLDQQEQHGVVGELVKRQAASGRRPRVLDAFCNQGSFALHAARAGAGDVLGLDSAEEAVALARRNAGQNGLAADFAVANVFDWFNAPERDADPQWDLIVLDPPPFARSKAALPGALRGYKEINLRAMQSLAPGGVLATYSCSHHFQDSDLRSVIAGAAADAKRRVHILEWCHQPLDHPVLAAMPESEYLRGYVLRVE